MFLLGFLLEGVLLDRFGLAVVAVFPFPAVTLRFLRFEHQPGGTMCPLVLSPFFFGLAPTKTRPL